MSGTRIAITGGAGFLGTQLARRLLAGPVALDGAAATQVGELVVVDLVAPAPDVAGDPRTTVLTGPLDEVLDQLHDVDAVFHLAGVVSGAAEADFDLGMRTNLDGTRAVLEHARHQDRPPLLVFTSSLAVFGSDPAGPTHDTVDDDTLPRPQSSYGVQKLVGEHLVADYTRKGFVRGRSVRLMTVSVRPGPPNAAASGFLSGMLREPLAGRRAACPVPPDTPVALSSPRRTIDGILRAAAVDAAAWGSRTAMNLPSITTTPREMAAALDRVTGADTSRLVDWTDDPTITAIVGSWPARFVTGRADALGLRPDDAVDDLVREHLADHPPPAPRYWDPDLAAGDHDDPDHVREHFDPLSRSLTRGRYTRVSRAMASACPVIHTDGFGDGVWTVSGYSQLVAVHRDEGAAYSNFPVLLQNFGQVRPMIPMESDPPLHRQYKQIIAAPLARGVQTAREPYYRDLVRRHLRAFLDDGHAELFEQLCTPVTVHALMDTLGIPDDDRERLAALAIRLVRGDADDGTPATEIYEYFAGLAAARRADPGEDIVSLLCTATVDGRPLTESEILDYCLILLPAGFETTASSMSFMFLVLAEDPELQRTLRTEPDRIPAALEEMMRYVTPTRSHTRTVVADTTLDGHELRDGDRVHLNWVGANHDPAVFERPEELRIDRSPNRHMSYGYGYGAHTCVGLHMARAEMKIAFEEVLAAMADIRLTDPDAVVEDVGTTWAITHLPVTFTRRS